MVDLSTEINNNINNGNEHIYIRDYLFSKNITEYNKYLREYNNYSIITYCCNIKTHSINGKVPLINNLISFFDSAYNVDMDLLIVSVCFKESRKKGVQLDLELIDPSIINTQTPKGSIGNKFISI